MISYPFKTCLLCDEEVDDHRLWKIQEGNPTTPPGWITEESFFNGPPKDKPVICKIDCIKVKPCEHVFHEDDIADICEILGGHASGDMREAMLHPFIGKAKRRAEKLNDDY